MRTVSTNEVKTNNEIIKEKILPPVGADCWFVVWRGSCVESHLVTLMLEGSIALVRGRNAQSRLRRAIHCIVTNALDANQRLEAKNDVSGKVAVKLTSGFWTLPKLPPESRLNSLRWVGAKSLRQALRLLESDGWITIQKGYWSGSRGKRHGKVTSYSATDKLKEVSNNYRLNLSPSKSVPRSNVCGQGVTATVALQPVLLEARAIESPMQLGHLRMSKKQGCQLDGQIELIAGSQVIDCSSAELKKLYSHLTNFNNENIKHEWLQTWPGYNYLGRQVLGSSSTLIQPDAVIYNRVFLRGRLDRGGRYYSVLSSVPRQHRLYITANGEQLVELDFRALHPRMLYDLNGLPPPTSDLYDVGLPSEYRDLVKCLVLLLINLPKDKGLRSIMGALNGFNGKAGLWTVSLKKRLAAEEHATQLGISKEKLVSQLPCRWRTEQVQQVLEAVRAKHAAITPFFFSDAGVYLQYFDSLIASSIATEFAEAKIPLLILHDGFFTVSSAAKKLEAAMLQSYSRVVGQVLSATEISHKKKPSVGSTGGAGFPEDPVSNL